MQVELKEIQNEVGITFVYVTHDQEEALTMSDRIAVFNEGRIEQVGAPADVYERPGNRSSRGSSVSRTSSSATDAGSRSARRRSGCSRRDRTQAGCTARAGLADVAYAGMITRYLVALEAGGELQIVHQNLETVQRGGARAGRTGGGRRMAAGTHGRGRSRERERRAVMRKVGGSPARSHGSCSRAADVHGRLRALAAATTTTATASRHGGATCRRRSARARAS